MKRIVCYIALITFSICFGKPMESIERYNIILVHGAADSLSGMDCKANDLYEAYSYYNPDKDEVFGRIKGYVQESGALWWKDESRSTATGMMKTLPDWINEKILDGDVNDRFGIYLNRPFLNPANTPIVNGGEIGNRKWKGRDNCKVRRSLLEEAEEMRSHGRDSLLLLRKGASIYRGYEDSVGYHTHRNILIAHSMGGLASREYVQGDDYNGDVDKVIMLDSPHKGTYSLDGLLYMKHYVTTKAAQTYTQMALVSGLAWILGKNDIVMNQTALMAVATGMTSTNVVNGLVDAIVDLALGYGFEDGDPLANYVVPGSSDLEKLNGKEWNDKSPMYRVLYGVGGLTFGSNKEYLQRYFSVMIPEGLFAMVKNIVAQISHTEIDNPAYWNNIVAGGALGLLGGLSLSDQGSILIPHWSGAGENVRVFDAPGADVVKVPFAANENVDNSNTVTTLLGIQSATIAGLYASEALNVFSPAAVAAAKTGLAVSAGAAMAAFIGPATIEAIKDMTENHKNPSQDYWHEKQKSKKNSYTKILGGSESVESYLLEDFLYEKPFVNLAVNNENDWTESIDSTKMDSLGLYGKNGGLAVKPMEAIRNAPLRFRSSSDWSRMGVKVDRWERVDGLTPDGELAPKSVPIRHMERYAAPSIAVDDWIEKYSFVVDDLMPHRLRQIRMNFNYQEEIAWECDISKDAQASDACVVYKRSGGGEWAVDSSVGDSGRVRHPVQKNGIFDFEPRKYGYDNLLLLQKDNQNTVTVSTVNKIGLSNTQRFYYLFKATDNLLEPLWPLPGVAVNRVSGFRAHASVLGYQGFSVVSARDAIFQDTSLPSPSSFLPMTRVPSGNRDAIFTSEREMSGLSGGYVWQFRTVTMDSVGGTLDSSDFYNVPFTVDTVPPSFRLSAEAFALNPDSVSFLARFAWDDAGVENPDIRAMRWQLSRVDGGLADSLELSSLYDVASQDFAVPFDSASRKFLAADGLYRVSAYAVDNAAPNASAYDAVNALVSKIADGTVSAGDWERVQGLGLNAGSASAEFRVDRTPPVLKFDTVGAVVPEGASAVGEYASLERPHRREGFAYVSDDSLLSVAYTVSS
ncbi:esterase/lipase family protein [Fibrobacter intestinalis]|nr:hypothetical protein [Fibrobacter sp. NR9]PBC72748.1 PGAP1-like protein [Fibrobacter sp. NR9]